MKGDVCNVCAGVGEVETMDGLVACSYCAGTGLDNPFTIPRCNPNSFRLAVEAINKAFKRRNKK